MEQLQFTTAEVLTRVFVSGCPKRSASILVGMGRLNGKSLRAWCYKGTNSGKTWCTKELQFREKDRLLFFQRNFQKSGITLYSWFSSRVPWIFQILNSSGLYMCNFQDLEVLQPRAFFSHRFISRRGLWRACWKWLFLKMYSQQWFWPLTNLSMLQNMLWGYVDFGSNMQK